MFEGMISADSNIRENCCAVPKTTIVHSAAVVRAVATKGNLCDQRIVKAVHPSARPGMGDYRVGGIVFSNGEVLNVGLPLRLSTPAPLS